MRLTTPADRAGWLRFALTAFTPAVIVFAAVGMAAAKTHGVAHVVFVVLTVVVWASCVGLLNHGRKRYWKRDE